MNVAIIPARGGSKRIPRKNIKMFGGKPMIAWSIEAAQNSGVFEKIIVSTDDDEIAEIAKKYGASVPFKRPSDLSNDYAGTIPVMRHACEFLRSNGVDITLACCIYATAPFLLGQDLINGLNRIKSENADYAFSVCRYAYPIQRSLLINDYGKIEMLNPYEFNTRSQDLIEAWHDAGQFYWGTYEAWTTEKPVFNSESIPIIIPRERAQDIDTDEDWRFAELLYEVSGKNGNFHKS